MPSQNFCFLLHSLLWRLESHPASFPGSHHPKGKIWSRVLKTLKSPLVFIDPDIKAL